MKKTFNVKPLGLSVLLVLLLGDATLLTTVAQAASEPGNSTGQADDSDARWQQFTRHSAWLDEQGLTQNAHELIDWIRGVRSHALDPQQYGLEQIRRDLDVLTDMQTPGTGAAFSALPAESAAVARLRRRQLQASLSAQLDGAFLKLTRHLAQGVVDGSQVQSRMYHRPAAIDPQALLEKVRDDRAQVAQVLQELVPDHDDYQRLSTRLRDLLTERASGVQRVRIAATQGSGRALSLAQIRALRVRLMDTGDLPLDSRPGYGFDRALSKALQAFQTRHGLAPSGNLDTATSRVLDLSIEEEIQAIALSLERWRWMPRDLGQRHILVNIPDFRVSVRQAGSTRLTMAAVVGEIEHPTPTFSRDMSYMDFNPTWTVPASIANRELLPREREQPGYLASRGFDYLTRIDGELVQVPHEHITEQDIQSDPFPYLLRQRSSDHNALGQVKFMMPNPYAIYLHDTPTKRHFSLEERAYSHGCIRLSEPHALARLLMQDDGHSEQSIKQAMADTEPRRIALRSPVPTHLAYLTTWVDENGQLQRRTDVYQQDQALLDALEAAGTLLTGLQRQSMSTASAV